MSGPCGCRVDIQIHGDVIGSVTFYTGSESPHIVYCSTHAAAFKLAEALAKFLAPYPDQCECAPGFTTTDETTFPTLVCAYCDARALLQEIGR